MTVNPTSVDYGHGRLEIEDDLSNKTSIDVALQGRDGSTDNIWGNFHYEAQTQLTLEVTRKQHTEDDPFVVVAIVEDNEDPAGSYEDTGGNLGTGVTEVISLGQHSTLSVGDTFTISTSALTKGGSYRLVLSFGSSETEAKDINEVDSIGDYHVDADRNSDSDSITRNFVTSNVALAGVTVNVSSLSAPSQQGYTDTPSISVSLATAGNAGAGLVNPRSVALAQRDGQGGAPKAPLIANVDANGDASTSFNVDTDWPEDPTDFTVEVTSGAYWFTDETGDEIPDSLKPQVVVDNGQVSGLEVPMTWVVFEDNGNLTNGKTVPGDLMRSFDAAGGNHLSPTLSDTDSQDQTLVYEQGDSTKEEWFFAHAGDNWQRETDAVAALNASSGALVAAQLRAGDTLVSHSLADVTFLDDDGGGAADFGLQVNSDGSTYTVEVARASLSVSGVFEAGERVGVWAWVKSDGTAKLVVIHEDGTKSTDTSSGETLPADSNAQVKTDPPEKLGMGEHRWWTDDTTFPSETDLDNMIDPTVTGATGFEKTLEGNEAVAFLNTKTDTSFGNGEGVFLDKSNAGVQVAHRVDVGSITRKANGADAGAGTTLYNRGEPVDIDLTFDNAFGTQIDPDGTDIRVITEDGTREHDETVQDTSPYNVSYTTVSIDDASFDQTGIEKTPTVIFGHYGSKDPSFAYDGVDQPKSVLLNLSRKILIGSSSDSQAIATNFELYNQGRSVLVEQTNTLFYARGDVFPNKTNLTVEFHDGTPTPDGTDASSDQDPVEASKAADTDANGNLIADGGGTLQYALDGTMTYKSEAPMSDDKSFGQPKHLRVVSDGDGNESEDSNHEWSASDAFGIGSTQGSDDGVVTTETTDGVSTSLFNRGETVDITAFVSMARGDAWDETGITVKVMTPGGSQEDSQTVSSDATGKINYTYTIGTSDAATNDTVGADKKLRVQDDGNSGESTAADSWSVSRTLLIGSTQGGSDREMASVTAADGSAATLFNRGEDVTVEFFLSYARGDPYDNPDGTGKTLDSLKFRDSNTNTQDTLSTVTTEGGTGKVTATYSIGSGDTATNDTTGEAYDLLVDHDNNKDNSDDGNFHVSSKLLIGSTQGSDDGAAASVTAADGDAATLFNRGEDITVAFFLSYARGDAYDDPDGTAQALDEWIPEDSANTGQQTLTTEQAGGSDGKVTTTYTAGSTDTATNDTTGEPYSVVVNDEGNSAETNDLYNLSSKLLVGSTAGSDDQSLAQALASDGAAETLFNRGETIQPEYFVSLARGDPYDLGTVTSEVQNNADQAVEDSQTVDPADADGKVSYTYTAASTDAAAYDTTGTPKDVLVTGDGNGNSTGRMTSQFNLSRKLLLHSSKVAASTDNDRTISNANGISLRNLGESHEFNLYLGFARGDPCTFDGIDFDIESDAASVEESITDETTDADGKVNHSYTIVSTDTSTSDKSGSPKTVASISDDNGNTADDSTSAWSVTDLLVVGEAEGSDNGQVETRDPDGDLETVFNLTEDVDLRYFLSFARGDAYDLGSVTAEVRDDSEATEDSRSVTPSGTGLLDYTYTIAASDTHTSDSTGSQKHVFVSDSTGNATETASGTVAPPQEEWGATDLLQINTVHTQTSQDENADDSPAGSLETDYVIASDECYVKAEVLNARGDAWSGATITVEHKEGGSIIESFSSQNSTTSGWPDAFYQLTVDTPTGTRTVVARADDGDNATTSDGSRTLNFISPQEGNKVVMVQAEPVTEPSATMRIHASFGQLNDAGDDIVWADGSTNVVGTSPVPQIEIYKFSEADDGARELVQDAADMTAHPDNQNNQGGQGADWYYDFTPTQKTGYAIVVFGTLNNVQIHQEVQFLAEDFERSGSPDEGGVAGIRALGTAEREAGDVDETVVADKAIPTDQGAGTRASSALNQKFASDESEILIERFGDETDYEVGDQVQLDDRGIDATVVDVEDKGDWVVLTCSNEPMGPDVPEADLDERIEKSERA